MKCIWLLKLPCRFCTVIFWGLFIWSSRYAIISSSPSLVKVACRLCIFSRNSRGLTMLFPWFQSSRSLTVIYPSVHAIGFATCYKWVFVLLGFDHDNSEWPSAFHLPSSVLDIGSCSHAPVISAFCNEWVFLQLWLISWVFGHIVATTLISLVSFSLEVNQLG